MSKVLPGPRNSLTDVPGIRVGNAADAKTLSGTTVILPERPMLAAVDVRGGGPGTRETDALDTSRLVEQVDAIVLSGGSAFGLAAADGAMSWLADHGRGFEVAGMRVPIVPGAVIFDLANGGDKNWPETFYRDLGKAACANASTEIALGNAGAGMGAKAGDLKGGLGTASAVMEDGVIVAALVIANPVGPVVMPGQSTLWAWSLEHNHEMGGQEPPTHGASLDPEFPFLTSLAEDGDSSSANTTLAVIATNADLNRSEAQRVAIMAHDGFARAIRPVHSPYDGDTAFVLAGGEHALNGDNRSLDVARIGALAADCVTRSIGRAVFHAESAGNFDSWCDRFGK